MSEIPGNNRGVNNFHLDWYKRYPTKMLAELTQLDVRTCGVYTIVCDLMFMKGGAIGHDDDDLVMHYLHGCNVRTWHACREVLLERGFFYRDGDMLRSRRVDAATQEAVARLAKKQAKFAQTSPKHRPNLNFAVNNIKDLATEETEIQI
jgi:uncharacterized protein YdaU (DUF1376 family)